LVDRKIQLIIFKFISIITKGR